VKNIKLRILVIIFVLAISTIMVAGAKPQCHRDSDCPVCKVCSNGACVAEAFGQDVRNECNYQVLYCTSLYSYYYVGQDCDGMGACIQRNHAVNRGQVCVDAQNFDTQPTKDFNCGIWKDCITSQATANEYFVGFTESMNGLCSTEDWQPAGTTWYTDEGYVINKTEQAPICSQMPACFDKDGDGVTDCAGDCNDNDNTIYPGAPEVCDAKDNNCNTLTDEPICNTATDADCDAVSDCSKDQCANTVSWLAPKWKTGYYDDRNWNAATSIYGCNCPQILNCKGGNIASELRFGCSLATKTAWEQHTLSWTINCHG